MTGQVSLSLNVGRSKNNAILCSGSGTSTLLLKYTVAEGQTTPSLDYNGVDALTVTGGYIRQEASNPATNAVLTLPFPHLQFSSTIIVHANIPKIISVSYGSGHSGKVFGVHDQISIVVVFSSRIMILHGPPALILNVGGEYREASYVSGSGLNSLTFNYTVLVGDAFPSSIFECSKLRTSALCLDNHKSEDFIWQLSSNPNLDADLTFPVMEGTFMELFHCFCYSISSNFTFTELYSH